VPVGKDPANLPLALRLALIARICEPWAVFGDIELISGNKLSLSEIVRRMDTVLWYASAGLDGHDWGYR
jgi:hypothetical protein